MFIKMLIALLVVLILVPVYVYTARNTKKMKRQWASCLEQSVSQSYSMLPLARTDIDKNTEYPFGEVIKKLNLPDDIRIQV